MEIPLWYFPQCGKYDLNFHIVEITEKVYHQELFKIVIKTVLFHNVQGKYRAVVTLKWFATESCVQLIYMPWDERWQKSHSLSCQKCQKSRIICYAKNVENPATFVEGFGPEFQARGSFIKYSMSVYSEVVLSKETRTFQRI